MAAAIRGGNSGEHRERQKREAKNSLHAAIQSSMCARSRPIGRYEFPVACSRHCERAVTVGVSLALAHQSRATVLHERAQHFFTNVRAIDHHHQ
jgi:hypothetical protein